MQRKESWKAKLAEDLLSLGSLVLYMIIIARALIGPYWLFFTQLTVGIIALMLLSLIFKKSESRISRPLILALFSVIFYHEIKFTIFMIFLAIAVIGAAVYAKVAKSSIIKGVIIGILSVIISYILSPLIVNFFNLAV